MAPHEMIPSQEAGFVPWAGSDISGDPDGYGPLSPRIFQINAFRPSIFCAIPMGHNRKTGTSGADNAHIADFVKSMKSRFTKCLEPEMKCPNDAIRAHSVQNATALSFIEENNHVSELKPRVVGGNLLCVFDRVGRNNASTFTGLCGHHDASIFLPIDTKPLDVTDHQQLFLIAYRSITRELHAVMEGAVRIQGTYVNAIEAGKITESEFNPAGFEAVKHMIKAWGVWKYRYKYFDQALQAGRFDRIKHSIFKIKDEKPILAASSFFSADRKPWGKKFAGVVLNVIPTGPTETTIIFSYASDQSGVARRYIAPVVLSAGDAKKYELSYMLINRAENFFMTPSHVLSWTADKRRHIETSFFSNVARDEDLPRDPEFMLFN